MGKCENRKAKKPLYKKAVVEANKIQPSCSNSAEQESWMNAYIAAGGKWECVDPKKKKVDNPVESCPNNESIEVLLKRLKRNEAYEWWPQEEQLPYCAEQYDMKHTEAEENGKLSQQGTTLVSNIPTGSCSIKYSKFYSEIENWMKEKLQ